jgi:hypothetical protein
MRVPLHGVLSRIFIKTGSKETRITRKSITPFAHCYQSGQLQKDAMSGALNTRERQAKFIYLFTQKA